jgi:hypothetical protein
VAESSPLKDRAFSTLLGQNLPFELRGKMGFRLRQIACWGAPSLSMQTAKVCLSDCRSSSACQYQANAQGARLQDIWVRGQRVNSFSWVALTSQSPETRKDDLSLPLSCDL